MASMSGQGGLVNLSEVLGADYKPAVTLLEFLLQVGKEPEWAASNTRNPRIEDVDPVGTFVLGLHSQFYATRSLSLLGEWVMSVESVNYPYDGVSGGIEIETRGHFFKILVTNQVRMNPTQFLLGTPFDYGGDAWRVGFNITRALSF